MLVQIKAFIKPYMGASFEAFQDRISINPDKLRFALADGVTQSYMPGQWAEALVESFVFSDKSITDWVSGLNLEMLSLLTKQWGEKEKKRLSYSSENHIRAYNRSSMRFNHTAASTFAGCCFQDNELHYAVIGDSCIFVIEQGEIKKVLSTVEDGGFSNTTSAIFSTGVIDGHFSIGVVDLAPGFVLLMSDALADWFSRQNSITKIIEDLWRINNHSEFDSYIGKIHESHSISNDDISVIMIRVSDGNKTEVLAYDDLESYLTHDNKEQSYAPETIIPNQEAQDRIDGCERNGGELKAKPIKVADDITDKDSLCEVKRENEEVSSDPETDNDENGSSPCDGNNNVSLVGINEGTVSVEITERIEIQDDNDFDAGIMEERHYKSVNSGDGFEPNVVVSDQTDKTSGAGSSTAVVNSDIYDSSDRIGTESITQGGSRKDSLWDFIKGLFK